jgi:hypothetical protein
MSTAGTCRHGETGPHDVTEAQLKALSDKGIREVGPGVYWVPLLNPIPGGPAAGYVCNGPVAEEPWKHVEAQTCACTRNPYIASHPVVALCRKCGLVLQYWDALAMGFVQTDAGARLCTYRSTEP